MFFAVGTVALLLAGVLTKNVNLASGMFIHELSVLLIVLNAMRLVRFKPANGLKRSTPPKEERAYMARECAHEC